MGEKVKGIKDMIDTKCDIGREQVAKEHTKLSEVWGKGGTIKQKMDKILRGSMTEFAGIR